MAWLALLTCAVVILLTGMRLATYGDVIAVRSGLGRTWVGVVMMAAATSLPELITGASAVARYDLPDIAAGDIFGSCLFNLLILAVLAMWDRRPLSEWLDAGQLLPAAIGMVLVGGAALALVGGEAVPAVWQVSVVTPVLVATYFVGMRLIFDRERARGEALPLEPADPAAPSLRRAIVWYVANAAMLMIAAGYLPVAGHAVAEATGLGESFVGTVFVAISTSAPEIVVTLAAARIGAVDMAAGNVLGSNLFNIALLGLDDLLYRPAPLFVAISPVHLVPAIGAMLMTAVVILSLVHQPRQPRRIPWEAVGMVLIYGATLALAAPVD
ncbi:MAG TPA: sodium:calcium antiporter [Methylomirabilota bacterium]